MIGAIATLSARMSEHSKVGSIAAIHRYPVKSMMGEELNAARIGVKGLQGDRVFALADPQTDRKSVV